MSEGWLITLQEAEMACHLLLAFDVKRKRDGPEKTWLSYYQALSIVLHDFDTGAARPFIMKLMKVSAFDYFTKPDGGEDRHVFRFTHESQQKVLDQLLRLADLLSQIFPPWTGQTPDSIRSPPDR